MLISFSCPNIQSLARERASAALQRQIASLPGKIEAIKREHSAKGLLRSGATLKRVLAIGVAAIEVQRDVLIEQYGWAVNQALIVREPWIEQLVLEATHSFQPLHDAIVEHFNAACAQVGQPELVTRLLADLEPLENAAKEEISLALRSRHAERSRGLVKGLTGLVPKIVSRILSGGAA